MARRAHFLALAIVVLAAGALAVMDTISQSRSSRAAAGLKATLESVVRPENGLAVDCARWANARPLVLLALGQSNAGNHGQLTPTVGHRVKLVSGSACIETADPLAGGTGGTGSIWSRLPDALAAVGYTRPVVIGVLGIDATSIGQWIEPTSPLRSRLASQLRAMIRVGLGPDLVLWQQGEADAQLQTPASVYGIGLQMLAQTLAEAGFGGPVLLAKSTLCRSPPAAALQMTIDAAVAANPRFRAGANTDSLSGPSMRVDGCHLSAAGLDAAARLWAEQILTAVSAPSG